MLPMFFNIDLDLPSPARLNPELVRARDLYKGNGVEQDPLQVIRILNRLANEGDAFAHLFLAAIHEKGDILPKCEKIIKHHYEAAAKSYNCNGSALRITGLRMITGKRGYAKKRTKGLLRLTRAIEMGDGIASAIEHCCVESQKRDNFVQHCKKFADLGDTDMQCYVGICYELGLGTPRNKGKAKDYFELAARTGHRVAKRFCKTVTP